MGDNPAELNFIKLKKWLKEAGCPKETVDAATGKDQLLEILPQYYTGPTGGSTCSHGSLNPFEKHPTAII